MPRALSTGSPAMAAERAAKMILGPEPSASRPSICSTVLPGTSQAVRAVLLDLRRRWGEIGVPGLTAALAEQVLAEVLNNIVEHALPDTPEGEIRLSLCIAPGGISFEVRDNGKPMPGGQIPGGRIAAPSDRIADLPEGGFGWAMIRAMTDDLRYQRCDGWNRLRFRVSDGGSML